MANRQTQRKRRWIKCNRRGNSVIEFALVLPLMVLMLTGTVTAALVFERQMTVVQLSRNAGNMFARGVDFTKTTNQEVLLKAASGIGMTTGSGSGVIYLSRLVKAADGTANAGKLVIAERYVIGDTSISKSKIGTPTSNIWPDPNKPLPHGDVLNPEGESSAKAKKLPAVLKNKLLDNGSAFVAEVYHKPSALLFAQFSTTNDLLYSRSVY